jgi:hypothetical protein
MKTIKIGLVQMHCEKGAIDGNLASMSSSDAPANVWKKFFTHLPWRMITLCGML